MVDVVNVSPHIPSADPQITRDFFVDLLDFKIQFESDSYIEIRNGSWVIGIQKAIGEPNQQSFYIQVKGIEELWEAKKESLYKYKTRELFVQDYGMKEFHVVAPETKTLVFVGEEVH